MRQLQHSFFACLLICPLTLSAADYSGFLDNYPDMTPGKKRESAATWFKPGATLKNYDKVFLDPILLYYDPASEDKSINPDKLKTFTDKFRGVIVDTLEPDYPVVSKPGAGVLRIRLAVTNISVKNAGISAKHALLPGGAALFALEQASGKSILVQNAVMEAELLDSNNDERLAVVIDHEPEETRKNKGDEDKQTWKDIEDTLKFYADQLRERLDKAHAQ